jgi:hypothetical protein
MWLHIIQVPLIALAVYRAGVGRQRAGGMNLGLSLPPVISYGIMNFST